MMFDHVMIQYEQLKVMFMFVASSIALVSLSYQFAITDDDDNDDDDDGDDGDDDDDDDEPAARHA